MKDHTTSCIHNFMNPYSFITINDLSSLTIKSTESAASI